MSAELTLAASPVRRRWLIGGLAIALVAIQWYVLAVRTPPPAGVPRQPGDFLVGEVAGETRVSQTVTLGVNGFDRLTIWPGGGAPIGNFLFQLFDVTGPAPRFLFGTRHPARDLVAATPYVLRFPMLERSHGRRYRFDLSLPDTPAGQGVSLWMHEGDSYPLGELAVNGRPQPADLVFEARARETTAWARMRRRIASGAAPVPGGAALLALLAFANLGVLAGVNRLLTAPAGSGA